MKHPWDAPFSNQQVENHRLRHLLFRSENHPDYVAGAARSRSRFVGLLGDALSARNLPLEREIHGRRFSTFQGPAIASRSHGV